MERAAVVAAAQSSARHRTGDEAADPVIVISQDEMSDVRTRRLRCGAFRDRTREAESGRAAAEVQQRCAKGV